MSSQINRVRRQREKNVRVLSELVESPKVELNKNTNLRSGTCQNSP